MTVKQYQDIARSYASTDDQTEQIALAVCHVYGLTHDEVDGMGKAEFLKHTADMTRTLQRIHTRPWYYRRILQTDATKITLGQFVEVQHFAKEGEADSVPLVAASVLLKRSKHKEDVERILRMNVRRVRQDVTDFMNSFNDLVLSYAGLFEDEELDPEATDEEVEAYEKQKKLAIHPFIDQYGWIFSAKQIALFEGITLDQAYELPITQALNDLAYLKSEADYKKKQDR